ncbi:hypothetical protein [Yoonia sp.]|uniref:hypothetical protein n=1 Tax=Yoonia sp. TaxID=2212373 RepID=UPI0039767254
MKRGRISFLIFLLILALPVVALNFGGFNVGGWISERTDQFMPQTAVPAAEAEAAPEDPFQWLNDRPDLRDTFIPNEMTQARYVTVEKVLSAEELLNDGEQAPEDAFLGLYAAARAPAQLIAYCAEVIATIGTTCDLTHTQTRENREGKWVMNGRLSFIPSSDLGDPSLVENGQLLSARAVLPQEGDLRPPNNAETRAAMLSQAQTLCDRLRDEFGNCVLTRVSLDVHELWITDLEVLPAGTNPQRLEATAEFTVYVDPMQVDATGFADLVAEIVNPA